MKKIFIFSLLFLIGGVANAQTFSDVFHDKSMRFDYYHCGDSTSEAFFYEKIVEEPYWGGSKVNLVDEAGYGNHLFKVIDKESGDLLYSRGYCSLFNEWQHTEEANTSRKGYKESLVFPYPKNDVVLEIYTRNFANGEFVKQFSKDIDPEYFQIIPHRAKGEVFDIEVNGDAATSIDIVVLSEGYTTDKKDKFVKDVERFAESLWAYSPFKEERKRFNVRAVWCGDGFGDGISIPKDDVWVNTPLNAKFYTFDSERYQMVDDLQVVRDYAANAPYDYIYILSNSTKYGGGGIYNFYGISSANHESLTAEVYVHEFGHLFMGLADEYEGDSEEMYNLEVEPWEENITTLVDFKSKNWSRMIGHKVEIPTEICDANKDVVGVYEGAGYVKKGAYRPWLECIMRSLNGTVFCPVCQDALKRHIDFLAK